MWDLLALAKVSDFSQEALGKRYLLAERLIQLSAIGWSSASLASLLATGSDLSDCRVGSADFRLIWSREKELKTSRDLLELLVNHLDLPKELSGQLAENQALVSRFSSDLAPHDVFWWDLAGLVNQAFPKEGLCQEVLLARQIHQLRYVISSQQAEYVREHYGKDQQTDAEALASYLKDQGLKYSLGYSARLHNKIKLENGKQIFPDGQISANVKLLINFHTEFILSSQGNFLNEVDARQISQAGIINGASFNYGRKKRHWDLDVKPVGVHDPAFRRRVKQGYRAPNRSRLSWSKQFDWSYFNKAGAYARNNKSLKALVKRAGRQFQALVKGKKMG